LPSNGGRPTGGGLKYRLRARRPKGRLPEGLAWPHWGEAAGPDPIRSSGAGAGYKMGGMDPATLALGAAVGGGVGTLAAIVIVAIVGRFAWKMWMDFDGLRSQALNELRAENEHLRKLLEERSDE
jgi:hypothetical protein